MPRPFLGCAGWLFILMAAGIDFAAPANGKCDSAAAGLFTNGAVHRLRIELRPDSLAALRQDAREYVPANLYEGGTVYPEVGIHLKGSTGSFRGLEDKPGLTLDFSRFNRRQRFHGLRKIHLNNAVEDPSYVNEQLGGEIFRAAGVPAPRTTYALVVLNEQPKGLYVLKEGFTEDFLADYFKQVDGQLYDTDFGHDVDQRMKQISGRDSPHDQPDLQALAAAALDPDLDRRWQKMQAVLDVRRFLVFMALEVMICHRDGYCLARNNFRIYQDPETGKMVFFPHGMDQLFGKSDLPWQPHMAGLVAKAVMESPAGRRQYAGCFSTLFTNLYRLQTLTNRVDQLVGQLRPVLAKRDFQAVAGEAALVKDRIIKRHISLAWQLSQPPLAILEFKDGGAPLAGWAKVDEPIGGSMARVEDPGGLMTLRIIAGPATSASWRTKALLEPGRYRFEGRGRVTGVKPLPFGKHQGAGLRIAGRVQPPDRLVGTSGWQKLGADFEVKANAEEIEFVCELRASAGEFWLDAHSLRVINTAGMVGNQVP